MSIVLVILAKLVSNITYCASNNYSCIKGYLVFLQVWLKEYFTILSSICLRVAIYGSLISTHLIKKERPKGTLE